MFKTIRSVILLSFIIISSVTCLRAQSKASKIDSLLQIANQREFFNGNALVAEKGEVIYRNEIGFADANRHRLLSPDLRFGIGSISKEFDGVALMLLAQNGAVSLDESLQEYIPELPDWSHDIRLRHLMQYSGGVPSPKSGTLRSDDAVLSYLQTLDSLSFKPGTSYNYNNIDVFLRKKVVEAASGKPFNRFLTDRILTPCGMTTAVIDATPETPNMAFSFDNYFTPDVLNITTTGWVFVTIQDIYRWTQCLHSNQLLSRESLTELFQTHRPNTQSPLGHAMYDDGEFVYQYHHGQNDNFEASVYVNEKEKFTIILLTNNRNSNVGDLTSAIDAILRGEPFEIPKKSIEMSLRTEIFYNGYKKGIELFRQILDSERAIYDFENEEDELLETGEYLVQKERFSDAVGILEFTALRFPNSSDAATELGKAYVRTGQPELALESFQRALSLNQDNEDAESYIREMTHVGRE